MNAGGVDWLEAFSGWLWFVLPLILPGFVAFQEGRDRPRRALAAAVLLTLAWGLWPVWMGEAPQFARRHLYFWLGSFLDQPELAAAGVLCLAASALCLAWALSKATLPRVLACLFSLSAYWTLCFYGYGFWISGLKP